MTDSLLQIPQPLVWVCVRWRRVVACSVNHTIFEIGDLQAMNQVAVCPHKVQFRCGFLPVFTASNLFLFSVLHIHLRSKAENHWITEQKFWMSYNTEVRTFRIWGPPPRSKVPLSTIGLYWNVLCQENQMMINLKNWSLVFSWFSS